MPSCPGPEQKTSVLSTVRSAVGDKVAIEVDGPSHFITKTQAERGEMLDNPDLCLRSEVLCCFCYASLATRWIIQDQMHIQNTCADDCITSKTLCLRNCLSYLCCSSNARAGARGPLVCFAFPCMAAQQTAMLDMRDANPTIIRPPFDPIRAPKLQVMNAPSIELTRECATEGANGAPKLAAACV
ncbi:hypothetical protein WJX75_002709 [Coccomyxa subellipsoidea]|uniref:Uncharacterized protein n=1 Tax=Coccomyxa subellipsoidea TaxID=248742 RepID=A0ABR2YG25_9CHLO